MWHVEAYTRRKGEVVYLRDLTVLKCWTKAADVDFIKSVFTQLMTDSCKEWNEIIRIYWVEELQPVSIDLSFMDISTRIKMAFKMKDFFHEESASYGRMAEGLADSTSHIYNLWKSYELHFQNLGNEVHDMILRINDLEVERLKKQEKS